MKKEKTIEDMKELKSECFKSLFCLYIATEKSTADDVNLKVKAYIGALENLTKRKG